MTTASKKTRERRAARNRDLVFAQLFADRGIRATRQRLAVLRLLDETKNHPTAADIHEQLLGDHADLSLKTVYEALETLTNGGLARRVAEGGGPFQYESRTDPHYHAQCRVCGVLIDVPARADGHIRGRTPLPKGFQLEEIRVLLVGCCPDCHDTE